MDPENRGRLLEVVEQAKQRAAEAAAQIEADDDAPRAIRSAVEEAQEALARLAERLRTDA